MLLFIVLILLFTGEMQLTNLNSSDRVEEHPPYVDLRYSFSDPIELRRTLCFHPLQHERERPIGAAYH